MSAIASRKTYACVWLALLALLLATWGFSRFDLAPFNLAIAMAISLAKMLLIIIFFMHARSSRPLIWVFAGAGFIWFFIMVELTLSDYLTRGYSWTP